MTEVTEELKSSLSRLSARDRAELAHFLLLSLEEGAVAGYGVCLGCGTGTKNG